MANDFDGSTFRFADILTEPLVKGLPGPRERLQRRRSFVGRYLQRYLRRLRRQPIEKREDVAPVAAAARLWRTTVNAFHSRRLDSLIRCIGGPRRAVDAHLQRGGSIDAPEVGLLTQKVWRDVQKELAARLEAVAEGLAAADANVTPDNFYWIKTARTPNARIWDGDAICFLAAEIRQVYRRLVGAKANLKFLALHIDDLRWLADFGAGAAASLVAVPSNRFIRRELKRADELKLRLNRDVTNIMGGDLGDDLRHEFKAARTRARGG